MIYEFGTQRRYMSLHTKFELLCKYKLRYVYGLGLFPARDAEDGAIHERRGQGHTCLTPVFALLWAPNTTRARPVSSTAMLNTLSDTLPGTYLVPTGLYMCRERDLKFGTVILEFGLAFGRDKIKNSVLKFGTVRLPESDNILEARPNWSGRDLVR